MKQKGKSLEEFKKENEEIKDLQNEFKGFQEDLMAKEGIR